MNIKNITNRITKTEQSLSALPLRLIAGIIFTAHGAQKLFAWFGGYGLNGTGQWLESIGLAPGYLMALMAGSAEFFGGLLLIIGFLTRPTSFVLAITMLVAIVTVHIDNGLFMANNGYEFGLSLIAITLALFIQGGGKYSVDEKIYQALNKAA
ncbi:DoxX family protein [Colwellia psychrerythraea]|uniref:DoxX family protein n=1 Tax=Colwellia psychrerythraea TaxID=28229 RepID=A0A099KM37_COLPS|nr:DoxX family protein [Colwellia psychrerythraea]KGJ90992.1 DoxX family protein [Colwellia psychrerythraea]